MTVHDLMRVHIDAKVGALLRQGFRIQQQVRKIPEGTMYGFRRGADYAAVCLDKDGNVVKGLVNIKGKVTAI